MILDIQREDWWDFADELGIRKQENFSRYFLGELYERKK